jgi:mannosyltransferase OCH1-like enzyme
MIPKIIHFVFGLRPDFGKKPFGLPHYLAIKSASKCNPDYQILFHCHYLPSGEWWDAIKDQLIVVPVEPPTEIFGNPIYHVAHQADVVRMEILRKTGGIYLDVDTITCKSFDDLLNNSCVIGIEGKRATGLCNAVIMAEPGNRFIEDWFQEYRTFASTGFNSTWGQHSIKLPLKMWKTGKYDDCLTVMPYNSFHYPTWSKKGTDMLFKDLHVFPDAYCHHLWESINWKHLSSLTVEKILNENTSYNLIARRYLYDL